MSNEILEPTFDSDGYPTPETLETVKKWDCIGRENKLALLAYVHKAWWAPEYFRIENDRYYVSTVGWSGNEDLIIALERNFLFWGMCWVQSRCGGHYIFEVDEPDDLPPAAPSCEDATAVKAARNTKSPDYLAGEKAGLEEAAKELEAVAAVLDEDGLASGPWRRMANNLRHLGEKEPPAAISDCATSDLEAARNTSKQKEKA